MLSCLNGPSNLSHKMSPCHGGPGRAFIHFIHPTRPCRSTHARLTRSLGSYRGGGWDSSNNHGDGSGSSNPEDPLNWGCEGPSTGNGSSRDWMMGNSSNLERDISSNRLSNGNRGLGKGYETDWDQNWSNYTRSRNSSSSSSSSSSSESSSVGEPSRSAGSSRSENDSFTTSTGVFWAPSTGYNISSYKRMNEERMEGLQWLSRYLAGKRQKGWLWKDEAKAFAELRRRGIECCAHHGGKHLYCVPGHRDLLSPGGVFRILFREVDVLRESNERAARVDQSIADDLRAAIKAKLPDEGVNGSQAPPESPSAQDPDPHSAPQQPSFECDDSPQECVNIFLWGNGQGLM